MASIFDDLWSQLPTTPPAGMDGLQWGRDPETGRPRLILPKGMFPGFMQDPITTPRARPDTEDVALPMQATMVAGAVPPQLAAPTQPMQPPAPPPALSPQATLGSGALSGLERAAGWLMAPNQPEVLGTITRDQAHAAELQQRDRALAADAFTPIAGPDGSIFTINKRTGQVSQATPRSLTPKVVDAGSNWLGEPQKMIQVGNNFYPIADYMRAQAGGLASSGPNGFNLDNVDHSLTGDAYLNQFPPEVQAAVKARVEGRTMPTGNARKGFTALINAVGAKYGSDVGVPMDDTSFMQRRQYRNQLAMASPQSAGGQRTLLGTALGHLAEVATTATTLGNYDTPLAPVGQAINNVRGLGTEQAAKINKLNDQVDKMAGEFGRLYSGAQGGGVHERDQTRARFGGFRTSAELAAALEASRDLVISRLLANEQQRDEILGTNSGVEFIGPKQRDYIRHIDEAISKLRGGRASTTKTDRPSLNDILTIK